MKKRLGLALLGLAVGILALVYALNSTFNPKPRIISEERTAFFIPAKELQHFFAQNEQTASQKYLDKVLEVAGIVTEIEGKSVVLDDRVLVNFLTLTENLPRTGERLVIKGRCVGFDELLLQVRIDQAQLNIDN